MFNRSGLNIDMMHSYISYMDVYMILETIDMRHYIDEILVSVSLVGILYCLLGIQVSKRQFSEITKIGSDWLVLTGEMYSLRQLYSCSEFIRSQLHIKGIVETSSE